MWGGDFYFPETKCKIRHEIIRCMGNCIPVTYDDYLYIQYYYGSLAKYCKVINYPRSIKIDNFQTINTLNATHKRILVGNSATPTNRHIEIFYKLINFKNIDILTPLSYGDEMYKQEIIKLGEKLFYDRFYPIIDMIEYDDYLSLLNTVDIAIFNHNRQQAVGNIILLLSMGKTIYLSSDNNVYNMLKDLKIVFKDISELKNDLEEISLENKTNNQKIIMETYSEENAVLQWSNVFE